MLLTLWLVVLLLGLAPAWDASTFKRVLQPVLDSSNSPSG